MPQDDYEGALKRALHISAEWLKIFNTGRWFCRVVSMLLQVGWDDATVPWVRFVEHTFLHLVNTLLIFSKNHLSNPSCLRSPVSEYFLKFLNDFLNRIKICIRNL